MGRIIDGLGIGVLSWRAHATLRASLDSYRENGFLDAIGERVIFFSDIDAQDRALAEEYGYRAAGGPNGGIAAGMRRLAEAMTSEYVLLLQNDNPIVEPRDHAVAELEGALALLRSGRADLARMRHRWRVGDDFSDAAKYLRYWPAHAVDPEFDPSAHGADPIVPEDRWIKRLRRVLRPIKARRMVGRSLFVETAPETLYPRDIRREGAFHLVSSRVLHFTDQCLLISRRTFLDVFMAHVDANPSSRRPNGFQAPEICINGPWWRERGFVVAQGRGIFTHARRDGSFRVGHKAYEPSAPSPGAHARQ